MEDYIGRLLQYSGPQARLYLNFCASTSPYTTLDSTVEAHMYPSKSELPHPRNAQTHAPAHSPHTQHARRAARRLHGQKAAAAGSADRALGPLWRWQGGDL